MQWASGRTKRGGKYIPRLHAPYRLHIKEVAKCSPANLSIYNQAKLDRRSQRIPSESSALISHRRRRLLYGGDSVLSTISHTRHCRRCRIWSCGLLPGTARRGMEQNTVKWPLCAHYIFMYAWKPVAGSKLLESICTKVTRVFDISASLKTVALRGPSEVHVTEGGLLSRFSSIFYLGLF